jgi:hypothetical protein
MLHVTTGQSPSHSDNGTEGTPVLRIPGRPYSMDSAKSCCSSKYASSNKWLPTPETT